MGGVAQLGERLPCTQEVIGSNPFTSTRIKIYAGRAANGERPTTQVGNLQARIQPEVYGKLFFGLFAKRIDVSQVTV